MGEPPGHRHRPDPAAASSSRASGRSGERPAPPVAGDRSASTRTDGYVDTAGPLARRTSQPGHQVDGPAVVEEFGSTVPAAPRLRRRGRRLPQPRRDGRRQAMSSRACRPSSRSATLTADAGASADPVLVEIVQGSLASVEMEVETAIARTSRSPMIRDAHDFRAGIHDRLLRKLTGRSYSALVHPVARDFPLDRDAPGRRVLPQRRLPLRGRHRPPARPLRHGAGVRRGRRAGRARSSPSSRPSATTTTSAAASPGRCPAARPRCSRRASWSRRSGCGTPAYPTAPRWRS